MTQHKPDTRLLATLQIRKRKRQCFLREFQAYPKGGFGARQSLLIRCWFHQKQFNAILRIHSCTSFAKQPLQDQQLNNHFQQGVKLQNGTPLKSSKPTRRLKDITVTGGCWFVGVFREPHLTFGRVRCDILIHTEFTRGLRWS